MRRRDFIGSSLAVAVPWIWGRQMTYVAAEEPSFSPRIDAERLVARNQNRSTVVAQQGMVCASQPLAAVAGLDLLKQGGSCVDAAIAANAVLGVTEPASNGIGGDLFAILWVEAERKLYGLNASGRSPYAWTLAEARARNLTMIPRISPLSWSVPGCVSGWEALQQRFGRLGLSRCLEAAIHYAAEGFPLSPLIAEHFSFGADVDPTLRALYHPTGKAPRYGEVIRNPLLANSLRQIAAEGAAAFYQGEIGNRIAAAAAARGGLMTPRDLADHQVTWVDPISTNYRGWDVWQLPPNGQGLAVLQMLNLLEQFDIGALGPNSADHLHLFVEAKKLVFEDRARFYGDPEFAKIPLEWLLSKEYARQRATLIDPRRASAAPRPGDPDLDSDTVYLTAADRDGNMISLIQSLYHGFGSTICPDGVGFSIQNRGQAFALRDDHPNGLAPHKRPFHTIIPGFVTRAGAPVLAYGVMGGDFQPQGHCQVLMNMIDFGMSPQQAGEQPRLAHNGGSTPWDGLVTASGELEPERGFSNELLQELAARGHRIKPTVSAHGGYQAIWRESEPLRYFGGSDPRKDGLAIGY